MKRQGHIWEWRRKDNGRIKPLERTTPVLLGLFSIIPLLADRLQQQGKQPVATAVWYRKKKPTFSDAIAAARRLLWQKTGFSTSDKDELRMC